MGKLSLPQTTEFPQLAEIADPDRLTRVLTAHLGPRFASGELALARCKLKRLYYKAGPEGHCRLHVSARIRNGGGGLAEQTFFGHLWPGARVEEQFARARERDLVQPRYGEPVTLIPDWNMILWAYPNDPRLVGLPLLSDPDRVLACIQESPERFGVPRGRTPVALDAQVTKYVPGQRCGVLFRLTLDGGGAHVVYGKAYRASKSESAWDIQRLVWNSEPRRRGHLRLPEPYAFDSDRNIVWQEALPGRPLAKTAGGRDLPATGHAVGRHLAAFHGAELDLPVGHTQASQLEDLDRTAASVAEAFPDLADRCGALHARLRATADSLGAEGLAPVHGSFKFSHIFLADDGVAFIDFDGATRGDPGYDVGRFIAHLEEMKATRKLPEELAERTVEGFVAGYDTAAERPLDERRTRWYTAAHLLSSQIHKGVKRFDRSPVEKLLPLAEEICPDA